MSGSLRKLVNVRAAAVTSARCVACADAAGAITIAETASAKTAQVDRGDLSMESGMLGCEGRYGSGLARDLSDRSQQLFAQKAVGGVRVAPHVPDQLDGYGAQVRRRLQHPQVEHSARHLLHAARHYSHQVGLA